MRWFCLLVVVVLAGCSTQHQRAETIQPGMTKEEVVSLLGEPTSTSLTGGRWESYTYKINQGDRGMVFLCAGAVMGGNPAPPECNEEPEGYYLTLTFDTGRVAYLSKSPRGKAQASQATYDQYESAHAAAQSRREADRAEQERRQMQEQEAERRRRCDDALRRQKMGAASDRRVEEACVPLVGF